MLRSALTLDASMSVRDTLKVLKKYPDRTEVILRRREGLQTYWYIRQLGDIRGLNLSDTLSLVDALDLHEYTASDCFQIRDYTRDQLEGLYGILLDGDRALGVLEPWPRQAAVSDEPKPAPPPPASAGGLFRRIRLSFGFGRPDSAEADYDSFEEVGDSESEPEYY